jgi:hypothetical protein
MKSEFSSSLIYFREADFMSEAAGGLILSKPIKAIFTDWEATPLADQSGSY